MTRTKTSSSCHVSHVHPNKWSIFFNSHFVFHQTWNIQSFWEVYPILCNLSLGITVYASTLITPTRLSRIPHPVETFQTTLAGHTGWQKNQPSLMGKKAWIHDIHLTQNVGSIIRWLQKMCPVQPKKTHTFFWGGSAEGVLEASTQAALQTAVSVFCNRSVVGGVP